MTDRDYERTENVAFFQTTGIASRDISRRMRENTRDEGVQDEVIDKIVTDLDFVGLIHKSLHIEERYADGTFEKNEIRYLMDYVYKHYKDDLDKFFADSKNIKEFGLNKSRVAPWYERKTQKRILEEFKRTHVAPEKPNNVGTLPPLKVEDFKWDKNHQIEQFSDYELYKLGYIAMEIMKGKGKIPDEVLNEAQNVQKRKDFIKSVSEEDYKAAGFTAEEIKTAKIEGVLPKGWNVHHKFHRKHKINGVDINYNAPENLVIMRYDDNDDRFMHNRLHHFEDAENAGKANLDLIWIPGKIYNPDKVISPEEIAKQSEEEMRVVLKPKTQEGRDVVEGMVASINAPKSPCKRRYNAWCARTSNNRGICG